MKQIILLRHAQAEPYTYDKEDIQRNLTNKGIADCHQISGKLKSLGFLPQQIIASSANRTKQTTAIFAKNLEISEKNISYKKAIYEELSTQDFLDFLSDIEDKTETLLFVGHNPDIQRFAYNLTTNFSQNVPPCCAIILQTDIQKWSEIGSKDFILLEILKPKN
ncbi:MAG: histidine phosphatase family protein [Flavobacteriaceae bacterium]|nr:histidine phosphatase family protein [Flavobacteriaceae bacterium]